MILNNVSKTTNIHFLYLSIMADIVVINFIINSISHDGSAYQMNPSKQSGP